MSRDRTFRSLEYLKKSAATSRVLNLWQISLREGSKPDHQENPFFRNSLLNRSMILKHRVRGSEADLFDYPVQTATKILLPIAERELRYGARFLFVGQRDFEEVADASFAEDLRRGSRDRLVLDIIAGLPSLDPFLMRESLKTNGFTPAACYFNLSDGDVERMAASARLELEPLVRMSFGDGHAFAAKSATLLSKLLSDANSAELEPLRRVMNMDAQQFREGVFCWKAFLYYKWQLRDLLPRIRKVVDEISVIRPVGPMEAEDRVYITRIKKDLRGWIFSATAAVTESLAAYDTAYAAMTQHSNPASFREFLLRAPAMFNSLGERLSAIEHVASFWRFRFPAGQLQRIGVDELIDIFMDFEASLNTVSVEPVHLS
ncbi:hypothetical protein ASE17_18000 [Phenylobacterium sp. Root77]|uniref:hypothetical protein n=1 Tax=unclassified Phenylobacterium TaxID=2640670 RepID=UPI0006FBCBE5|nr:MULTISPECIES: hypothetical protein [unclassified Phenylobacterium]KQW70761.1 hypothetical protein ASC73_11870 [Phenylobacterium sp. Root1277]KQW90816.1 hypothetical protein ASC79_15720 [Phenylobacterium sp. Root1290]KRC39551.1 hypothetical protein ASE17_18000 [Phenylobacterium sp. Root77]